MTGAADVMSRVVGVAQLARAQNAVVSRAQLAALGVREHHVENQLRARRWRTITRDVVVLHTGPLVREAQLWAATMAAGPGSALCSWSTLALRGLRGWDRDEVHVVVPRGSRPARMPGVVVHESRRHGPEDVLRHRGLPTHSIARAAVDAAAWSGSPRTAVGLLAAVVQQGMTTPTALHAALDAAGRVRYHKLMALSLDDIAGGADSLAEIDFTRLCRAAKLPEPARQSRRVDARGRARFLDAEWDLPDGRRLLVEVDGVGHMDALRWYDDLMRTAELPSADGSALIRIPAAAARTEPERLVAILRRHLAPRP